MFQTLKNAWKTQELKTKLLFTLLIVVLYRLGSAIPVPWIDSSVIAGSLTQNMNYAVQLIAGDAFAQANLFALSVSPYITSSIIIQLLTIVIPALERWSKEGEEGKKKINFLTRIVTMALALVTSFGYALMCITRGFTSLTIMKNNALYWAGNDTQKVSGLFGETGVFTNVGFQFVVMIACYVAGAALVMWLAEKINERGIGNGISIILFANIIARLPNTFVGLFKMVKDAIHGVTVSKPAENAVFTLVCSIVWALFVVALLIALSWLIVWFTDSERRIPVQYAKKVVGRKMYGGSSSNLPLKLNMAGVMPVIFANSIVSIPGTLATIFPNAEWLTNLSNNYFNYTKPLYVLLSVILLFVFAYFYILISFNPTEVANNIRNNGGAVPGIRPGKPTRDYIQKVLNRITLIGAVFLCVVSELPKVLVSLFATCNDFLIVFKDNVVLKAINDFYNTGYYSVEAMGSAQHVFLTIAFSGTSVLIVVGVILETVRELEAQLTMRNYKGFLD